MAFAIQWNCQQGTRTADNRDHVGIGVRGNSILAIVLDGSTSGTASGLFVRELARRIVDWFMTTAAEVINESVTEQLRIIHATLAADFRTDSASYVLVYAKAALPAFVLHAGDCLVGHRDADGRISWLLQPHTLANALTAVPHDVLAKSDARHVLTRSFRSRNFIAPEPTMIELQDLTLFAATDGFWADLDLDGQNAFIEGRFPSDESERDDRGVLSISRTANGTLTVLTGTHTPESMYFQRA